jgi:hypothetical protein
VESQTRCVVTIEGQTRSVVDIEGQSRSVVDIEGQSRSVVNRSCAAKRVTAAPPPRQKRRLNRPSG